MKSTAVSIGPRFGGFAGGFAGGESAAKRVMS